jgi:3-methyladenine DNA glycosylase/8-oxoguanine DNA glycosylase
VDASLDAKEQQEIERVVIWMLGLDQDFSAFYIHARGEPKLQAMVAGRRGRVLRCPSLFEDIIKTILTTNTLWGGTIRMTANLVAFYGDPHPADPTRRAFPSPERLATLDEESLRESVRVGYRAPYILELARGVASGVVDLEAFKSSTLPTIELRKELMRIKGVGGYAAANLLMILGRYDFIPVDSWALKMVSHEWHAGESITPADVESAFAHWGEWKGLAFWFWDWAYQG